MPKYYYVGTKDGAATSGYVEASSEGAARGALQNKGITVGHIDDDDAFFDLSDAAAKSTSPPPPAGARPSKPGTRTPTSPEDREAAENALPPPNPGSGAAPPPPPPRPPAPPPAPAPDPPDDPSGGAAQPTPATSRATGDLGQAVELLRQLVDLSNVSNILTTAILSSVTGGTMVHVPDVGGVTPLPPVEVTTADTGDDSEHHWFPGTTAHGPFPAGGTGGPGGAGGTGGPGGVGGTGGTGSGAAGLGGYVPPPGYAGYLPPAPPHSLGESMTGGGSAGILGGFFGRARHFAGGLAPAKAVKAAFRGVKLGRARSRAGGGSGGALSAVSGAVGGLKRHLMKATATGHGITSGIKQGRLGGMRTGHTLARLVGGGARASKLLGGAGAAVGGVVGGVAGGVGGLATAFAVAVSSVEKWTNAALESARKLAEVSGSMAAVMAQRDVQQMMRDVYRGEATAGTASGLADSESALKDALQPMLITLDNLTNTVLATLNDILVPIIQVISDFLKEIYNLVRKILEFFHIDIPAWAGAGPGGDPEGAARAGLEAAAAMAAMDAAGARLRAAAMAAAGMPAAPAGAARPGALGGP